MKIEDITPGSTITVKPFYRRNARRFLIESVEGTPSGTAAWVTGYEVTTRGTRRMRAGRLARLHYVFLEDVVAVVTPKEATPVKREDIKPYSIIKVRREGDRNARHIEVERVSRQAFYQSDDEVEVVGYRVNAKGERLHSRGGWARSFTVKLADIITD